MRWSIESRIWAGFGVALVLLSGLATSSYRSTQRALGNTRGLEHSQQVLDHLNNVLIDLLDDELAARSFALTGNTAELARGRGDKEDETRRLQELRRLLAGDDLQHRQLEALTSGLNAMQTFLGGVNDARQGKGAAAAEELLRSNRAALAIWVTSP